MNLAVGHSVQPNITHNTTHRTLNFLNSWSFYCQVLDYLYSSTSWSKAENSQIMSVVKQFFHFPLHIWIWLQTETKNKTSVPWHIVTGEHCSQLQNHGSTQKTLWQNKRMHDDTLCHYCSIQFHAHWALKQVLSIVQPFDARGTFSGFCLPIGLSWVSWNPVGELNTPRD